VDPVAFHAACLEAYEASQVARGFSQTTMDNWAGVLERFLIACGRPAWEVTCEDVDRVVAGLAVQGLAASTRRGYVQAFKSFHAAGVWSGPGPAVSMMVLRAWAALRPDGRPLRVAPPRRACGQLGDRGVSEP
jgi:hypothetical protein